MLQHQRRNMHVRAALFLTVIATAYFSPLTSLAAERVEVSAQIVPSNGGQHAELRITAKIQSGWHIYSVTQKPGGPKPTHINLVATDRYRLLGKFIAVPPATTHHYDFWPDLNVEEHEDQDCDVQ